MVELSRKQCRDMERSADEHPQRADAAEPAGTAGLPRRNGQPHGRRRQRVCAGQSRDPAGKAGRRRFTALPAQPEALPDIGMSDVGDPRIPALGLDLDIRTDVPRYRVWRDGEVAEEPTDIMAHWRDDLVAFVLGCSFSFEEALMAEGLPIRHIERNVGCRCTAPISPAARRARSRADGGVHAAVQAGGCDPRGADHLALSRRARRAGPSRPSPFDRDRGYCTSPIMATRCRCSDDEIPVFWACGVTPQSVIAAAKLPFAITHAPGLMLVTDLRNTQMAVL